MKTPIHDPSRSGPLLALSSALLFGSSTPLAKLLLGETDPLLLAGMFYLGSGCGLALISLGGCMFGIPRGPKRACAGTI